MKQIKFNVLLVFLLQIGFSFSQEPERQQLHFYDGKDKNGSNTLDMEFHGDTLLYFRPESMSYRYYLDTIYEKSGEMRIETVIFDSAIVDRLFLGRAALWLNSESKDSMKYKVLSYRWSSKTGGNEVKVAPYQLYFDKNKESMGCMFPSNLSIRFEYYMYDPKKSHIVTKYEGKKWFFLFGKLKRGYKFRYYYYDHHDTTKLKWYHDLYLDKNKLPLVMDEAPVFTISHEKGTTRYEYTINRRIQYRNDRKKRK